LALVADTWLSGLLVARELNAIIRLRGGPDTIASDNGIELPSMTILRCYGPGERVTLPVRQLALVASIHDLSMLFNTEGVDGQGEPGHPREASCLQIREISQRRVSETLWQRAATIKLALPRRAADAGADIGGPALAGRRQAKVERATIRRRCRPYDACPHRSGLRDSDRLLARDAAAQQGDEDGGRAEMMKLHGFSNAGGAGNRSRTDPAQPA